MIEANQDLTTSDAGLSMLKGSEGFRSTIYTDGGKPAIGYGCDLTPSEAAEYQGVTITEALADRLLQEKLAPVEAAIRNLVNVPLTQPQFDALVNFTYNIGTGALSRSSMLDVLNEGNYNDAAARMKTWIYSNGIVNPGLKARRDKEAALFLS